MDISERITLLKNQLQELNEELKKSESSWIQSLDSFETAQKSLDIPVTKEGLRVISGQYKQVLATQLEVFRTNSRIIRKISPKAGEYLDEKIKIIEENDRIFQKLNFDEHTSQDEIDPVLKQWTQLYSDISNDIKFFRIIIQDTIKKLES